MNSVIQVLDLKCFGIEHNSEGVYDKTATVIFNDTIETYKTKYGKHNPNK